MRRGIFKIAFLLAGMTLTVQAKAQRQPRADGYQIVHTYPHDAQAFTQGLVYVDGFLYESTGLNGKSSIRKVEVTTGKVLQRYDLADQYFGEGLTAWGNDLVQLTWRAELGFVYDRSNLRWKRSFRYPGEGWGLTHDEKQLILSDGTPELRFLDPQTFEEIRRISVTDENGKPVSEINELEYIRGEIYANLWRTDQIVRISPRTGKVLGRIDLNGLIDKSKLTNRDAVLNGIAYDAAHDRIFVTGKLWPNLFEIKIVRHSRN